MTDRLSGRYDFAEESGSPEPRDPYYLHELISEIMLMERFSRTRGIALAETVLNDLAKLFSMPARRMRETEISDNESDEFGNAETPTKNPEKQSQLGQALHVHAQLARTISPATPGTIKASDLRHNRTLLIIGGAGAFALIMLIWLSIPGASNDDSQSASVQVATQLFGAMLGATLHAFWTARTFIRDGTFRAQYNQVYALRFATGILTGFILSSIASQSTMFTGGTVEQIGPLAIAIVGGFSAEAVVQILQRISDILVAAVKGSDRDAARTEAETESRRKQQQAAAQLGEAMEITDEGERAEAIRTVIADLLAR